MPSKKMAPERSGEPWCSSTITPANFGWAVITGGEDCGFFREPIIAWHHKIPLDGTVEVEPVTVHGTNGSSFGGFAIEKPPGARHRYSNLPDRLHGKPLLSSSWPWAEQTRVLIARKRLTGGGAS